MLCPQGPGVYSQRCLPDLEIGIGHVPFRPNACYGSHDMIECFADRYGLDRLSIETITK